MTDFPKSVNSTEESKVINPSCFKILAFNLRVESGIFDFLDSFVRNEVIVSQPLTSKRIRIWFLLSALAKSFFKISLCFLDVHIGCSSHSLSILSKEKLFKTSRQVYMPQSKGYELTALISTSESTFW